MLLVLVGNAVYTRKQVADELQQGTWVLHSREVMLRLAETDSQMGDAESGQRGYLYTGEKKYLAPYTASSSHVQSSLNRLAELTRDNQTQQRNLAELRKLVQDKLGELAETVAMADAGDTAGAKRLVVSDLGLHLMQQIRTKTEQMRSEEERLINERTMEHDRSVRSTYRAIKAASALAILSLALLAFYILREMEMRKRHARQLLEREEWFRVTLSSLGDAVIATDEKGCVTYMNPLAEELIGTTLSQVKTRRVEDVFPIFNEHTGAVVENPVEKVLAVGRTVGLANHTMLQRADGSRIPIEDSAAPIRDEEDALLGVVLVFRDATQERRAQEALRESEKLTSAARMSATVAHEINNPLEAVGNLIYLAKGSEGMPVEAMQHLDLAEQELERVAHITKQTLGFYREAKAQENIDLAELVNYVVRLYRNKLSAKRIILERDFDQCPPVLGRAGELKQAIANLLSNAADAVGEQGTIVFRLRCADRNSGKGTLLIVEDNGPGIPESIANRIFEPFFTTKKDVGNGLGLWVTKEIIERHGGTLELLPHGESGSGGAAFHIALPGA